MDINIFEASIVSRLLRMNFIYYYMVNHADFTFYNVIYSDITDALKKTTIIVFLPFLTFNEDTGFVHLLLTHMMCMMIGGSLKLKRE